MSAQTVNSQTGYKSDLVAIDKNKSAEQYIAEVEAIYIVPALIREKYPDLVKLIYETDSIDKDEREYWLQIMPIMNDEQIVKLRGIMLNEQKQLEEIETKYGGAAKVVKELDAEAIRKRQEQLKFQEQESQEREREEEERLLRELDNFGNL